MSYTCHDVANACKRDSPVCLSRERMQQAIKTILTELQTALMEAKEAQKKDILMLGKLLYNKAMKDARAIIEQNKQLLKENHILSAENVGLKKNESPQWTRMPSMTCANGRMQK